MSANLPAMINAPRVAVLEMDGAHVEYADGVPAAWRVLAYGPFTIYQSGTEQTGFLTEAHVDAMLAYYAAKGSRLPIDSRHYVYRLAAKYGVEEAELIQALGTDKLAMGFGVPAKRADGLWIEQVQWTDLGRAVMQEGAFRYFSPVIRGAYEATNDLRFTSLAMTNEPAINGLGSLSALAASDDDFCAPLAVSDADVKRALAPNKKGAVIMTVLRKLVAALGMDPAVAVLSDDNPSQSLTEAIDALPARLAAAEAASAAIGDLRAALVADAQTPLPALIGKVQALAEKAKLADDLSAKVDALVADAEAAKRAKLIEDGLAAGKLTPHLAESFAKKQSVAVLEAYLADAPVIVPPGKSAKTPGPKSRTQSDAVLSDDERAAIQRFGLSHLAGDIEALRKASAVNA